MPIIFLCFEILTFTIIPATMQQSVTQLHSANTYIIYRSIKHFNRAHIQLPLNKTTHLAKTMALKLQSTIDLTSGIAPT